MSAYKKYFIIAASGACLLWNVALLLFLTKSESGAAAVICLLAGLSAGGLLHGLVCGVWNKYLPFDPKKRRIVFEFCALFICFVILLNTPYSPAHDSLDMSGFLSTFVRKTTLSDYADKYLSFYGTNRICMYFYKPFVTLWDSVRSGTIAANALFLLTAMFCVSDICYKKFGNRCGELSLFFMPSLIPYMMMSGPYIYPPSIFLSAIALCLFFSHRKRIKLLSAVFFGILMLMRPTSALFWVIFIAASLIIKRADNITTRVCFAIVLVLISVCTKSVASEIMYRSGAYPYPQLTNSAMQWTLELGLRPQGLETGKCTYSAISGQPFDEISAVFRDLWDAYDGADDNETYRIHCLNKKLNTMIAERAKNTVFSDLKSLSHHIKHKYVNMFSDEYKAYYYAVNISDEDFADNLYKNYEWRYFLSENVILIAFAIACVCVCAFSIVRTYRGKRTATELLCMALSAMAVLCGFVLLTEVGKRLIFDLYVPMCVVICAVGARATNVFCGKIRGGYGNSALCLCVGILLICIAQMLYSLKNIQPFKACIISYTNRDTVVLTLRAPVSDEGYSLWCADNTDISLTGRENILLPLKKHDRQSTDLILPDGQTIVITNYEVK